VGAAFDPRVGFAPNAIPHYNQNYSNGEDQRHLFGKALQEGSCGMIGELISGRTINEHLQVYGQTHGAEIWRDFEAHMYKPEISNWFTTRPPATAGGTDCLQ
jgi:hypothetical protein